jgi:UDP-2,3-diacylglucosamine pyrophosphatase LpxH
MKIRPFSDLHCEFAPYKIQPLESDKDTIGVLVGDIGLVARPETILPALTQASEMFDHVFYVLGNHEFYHGVYPTAYDVVRRMLEEEYLDNVQLLQNEYTVIGGVAFIGATLWTDLTNPMDRLLTQRSLNDFRLIDKPPGQGFFLAGDAHEEYLISREFVFGKVKEMKERGLKTVVLVHHGVSPMSVHERFRGMSLNVAFVSDLTDMIADTQPTLIVHGHVHNHFDYMIDNTRIVANPRGYPREMSGHVPDMVIEI